jgi:murein L,D-transpeptidase YafK
MKKGIHRKLLFICCLFLCCCLYDLTAIAGSIPSSKRSVDAVNRVKPGLLKELSQKKLTFGSPVFIRVFKESKELEVFVKNGTSYTLFRTWPVCTYGFGGLGPKIRQGDGMASEGFYRLTPASLNPSSQFHLAFNLGYPNLYDRFHKRTGSALMIHGDCVSIGCYAMTDEGIEEIYTLVDGALRNGQSAVDVHIFPFRMTDDAMKKHGDSKWSGFWMNLKEGFDAFEKKRVPPKIGVIKGRYEVQ